MEIIYDPAKNERNIAERALPFDLAANMDLGEAFILEDTRKAYPERRFQALGEINGRLHMLVFAIESGKVKVISFRKANKRERKKYANAKAKP